MNLFVTSLCPEESANALDNKRLGKMIIETAQMLSVALGEQGKPRLVNNNGEPMKPTHVYHPCTRWICANDDNFNWALQHFDCLGREFVRRFSKYHATHRNNVHIVGNRGWTQEGLSSFANCSMFKDNPNVFEAYRDTMKEKWALEKPSWGFRGPPSWLHKGEKSD